MTRRVAVATVPKPKMLRAAYDTPPAKMHYMELARQEHAPVPAPLPEIEIFMQSLHTAIGGAETSYHKLAARLVSVRFDEPPTGTENVPLVQGRTVLAKFLDEITRRVEVLDQMLQYQARTLDLPTGL